jgi:hypothetical protein
MFNFDLYVEYAEQGYGVPGVPAVQAVAKLPDTFSKFPILLPTAGVDSISSGVGYRDGTTSLEGSDYNFVFNQITSGNMSRNEEMALLADMSSRYNAADQLAIDREELHVWYAVNFNPMDRSTFRRGNEVPKSR